MSLIYTQKKYIDRFAYLLRLFEWEGGYRCTFRCPFCGDSKKKQTKKRGNLFVPPRSDSFIFKCHNCGIPKSFLALLEHVAPHEVPSYKLDAFKQGSARTSRGQVNHTDSYDIFTQTKKIEATTLDILPVTHKAVQYAMSRKIPSSQLSRLAYTEDFNALVQKYNPSFAERLPSNEDRLVIPFYNANNELIAFQGRSFSPTSTLRYITLKVREETKVFGEEKLNRDRTVFAVEGPIDSLFLPNCIAKADGDIGQLKADIYIVDNQFRNREVVATLSQMIEENKRVVIFPDWVKSKDINQMVLEEIEHKDLIRLIAQNVYQGMAAKLRFAEKVKLNQ